MANIEGVSTDSFGMLRTIEGPSVSGFRQEGSISLIPQVSKTQSEHKIDVPGFLDYVERVRTYRGTSRMHHHRF